ncbi:hypothetical protein CBE01nite_34580 [Clostridium beijerinckii]|uniref:Uncharacterized protein n=1 Tax=Clostridium beijerinckii TaxID=1520 RepID=A0AB74VFT1_CLOBE|nr:hypothetical protein [Clostridium beijerinckii]NRZ24371.1 hypothetical protein [Clostridium beijerinckii]NYB99410.1 hypothetical protein [Clostridium beijerinckii]OOM21582.1 hypothetical protein CLBEI_37150 [Clostridium beijerinckii]QUN35207.1 hypothetical protein KEC93_25475 [Clostridium beijerinckii]SQB20284.1 Uncharacterised protein [Clostridium beijerinckii]
MMIELLKERIEEIKADIKEFTILELEANNERDKLKYELRVAEFQGTLEIIEDGLKFAMACEETDKTMRIFLKDTERLMKIFFNDMGL